MWTIPPSPRPYQHGNLPDALRAAAREILDEGGPEAVLLREVARRVGVTAAAAYRHFHGKEGLLASVATEGFRELASAMEEAAAETDSLTRARLAYVQFALQKRGLFRMMFGPILAQRAKYPELSAALSVVQRMVTGVDGPPEESATAIAAWGLVHGLSALFVDGLVPEARAGRLAEEIIGRQRAAARHCVLPGVRSGTAPEHCLDRRAIWNDA
jgi:AcrR family transcriptional regulator